MGNFRNGCPLDILFLAEIKPDWLAGRQMLVILIKNPTLRINKPANSGSSKDVVASRADRACLNVFADGQFRH
jgi:hypothetical protein